ncbi:Ribose ABC transport system, high affinity permease RbsD [Alkalibacterium sp. AK22]|nr:Ribose ABC transport system, high affinity permease RbsD [Alkalibacterium sp. AK22]
MLADLGHTDEVVIADCGLPVPEGVTKIDLALKPGTPGFLEVLETLLSEMKVETVTLAEEIKEQNQLIHQRLLEQISKEDIPASYITHETFKEQSRQAKAIIRTGEITPYANVILQAGVIF